MSGNSILLDSNIVLYLLNGEKTLIPILEGKSLYISFITELEVLGYHGITEKEMKFVQDFIRECTIIDISPAIKASAIKLRREYQLKLPDSIIAATSTFINAPLLTADSDFKKLEKEIDLVFYE